MKNIILVISLLLNIALYTGFIDSMQYKKLVDSGVTTGKNIITSDKIKDVGSEISKEVSNGVGKELKNIQTEKQKTLQEKIKERQSSLNK